MALFTKESLETLRQRIDLVEALSPYMQFSRAGSAFKALCPFHEEKTPSFIIQKGDSHYHCYGCGAHGDAIQFLMNYQKMGFSEAVEFLANRFQVTLEQTEQTQEKGPNKALLKEALEKAAQFYHICLLHTSEGHKVLEYLYKRGIDLDFIKTFLIGFSPQEPLFFKAMQECKILDSTLEEAGLLRQSNFGKKEFFLDRIMFPIRDPMGNVIGFSARKYKEETFGGKYINSPETPLFKKSKVLFGLNYSRKRIAKERKAIIVEGQIDALRLIYSGLTLAIAGQGTAFGEDHVQELLSLGVNRVYLATDPDLAGQEAAMKIGNLFQKQAIEVFVVALPVHTDPDSFVREKGIDEFTKLLERAKDYLQYLIEQKTKTLDMNSPSAKNELVQSVAKQIRLWDHPLMVHESLRKLARLTHTSETAIGLGQASPNVLIKKEAHLSFGEIDPDRILETDLLRWLLLMGEGKEKFIEIVEKNLKSEDFKISACRKIFTRYMSSYKENRPRDLLSLAIDLDDTESQLFLSELLQKKVNREKAEDVFLLTIQKILERNWMEKREAIKVKIQSGSCTDEEAFALAKEFDLLKKERPEVIGSFKEKKSEDSSDKGVGELSEDSEGGVEKSSESTSLKQSELI